MNWLPKSGHPTAKANLRESRQAEAGATAEAAMTTFAAKSGAKDAYAITCLMKDRDALIAILGFPARHRGHLRSANRSLS